MLTSMLFLTCTSCWPVFCSDLYFMLTCILFWPIPHTDQYSVLTCTSCWSVFCSDQHSVLTCIMCWPVICDSLIVYTIKSTFYISFSSTQWLNIWYYDYMSSLRHMRLSNISLKYVWQENIKFCFTKLLANELRKPLMLSHHNAFKCMSELSWQSAR